MVERSDKPVVGTPESVVVLVHGIRTYAPWVAMLRAEFEKAGIVVEPTNYGRFDALRFLWGFRSTPLDAVWESVLDIQRLYPGARISFLAHSFGTYIVSRLLEREFSFKAHRVVFCGSVVHYRFPFKQIRERFTTPVLNETSGRDPWPVFAESLSWGYGSAGTYGFRIPGVRDRWHRGFGHSQYLTPEFCRKFWLPFFKDGTIIEGDLFDDSPSLWIRLLSVLRLKYIVPLLIIGIAVALYHNSGNSGYPSFPGSTSKPPNFTYNAEQKPEPQILGPKPNPNCNEAVRIDSTVIPPVSVKYWDCP